MPSPLVFGDIVPSGSKRKLGLPVKMKKRESMDGESDRRKRRQPVTSETRPYRVKPTFHGMIDHSEQASHADRNRALGQFHHEYVDALACCSSSSMTALGRFGVWHPEQSIVKNPRNLLSVPTVEELEGEYKIAKRRQREREDGATGALFFEIQEPFAGATSKHGVLSAHCDSAADIGEGSSKDDAMQHLKGRETCVEAESYFETEEGLRFSDLQTGDDAIQYFIELGSGSPVQLVYCNRVVLGKEFTPYDLAVVPRANVDPEHFIISAAGLVHVEPGPGCHIPLQWVFSCMRFLW